MASDLPHSAPDASGAAGDTPSAHLIRSGFDWAGEHWRALLAAGAVAVLGAAILSGFYRVDVGETASQRRFGELLDAGIQPGLHWRVPFGVDRIDRFKTDRVYRVEIDGQINPAMSTFTGDFNLIDARFAAQYRVVDLAQFLFSSEDPVEILSREVRSAFVDTVSNLFVDMVLATEKSYVEDTVLNAAQQDIARLDLGLKLISINLVHVQPPVDAIAAFRAVNDAKAQKQEVIDAAVRRSDQTLAQARGTAAHIVEASEAEAQARIAEAESAATRFNAMLQAMQEKPDQATLTHYWNSVRRVLGKARIVVLQPGEAPAIGINLLEGQGAPPPVTGPDKKYAPGAMATRPGQEEAHPGADAAHATEDMNDRAPGYGGHRPGAEEHHFGPVPDETRQIPTHRLDPNVQNPQPPQPSHLGLPHNDPAPGKGAKK